MIRIINKHLKIVFIFDRFFNLHEIRNFGYIQSKSTMKIKEYKNFHEFIIKLQQRVHLLLVLPMIIFVYLFIKIENAQFHPFLIDIDFLYYTRNTVSLLSFFVIAISLIYYTRKVKQIRPIGRLRTKLNQYYSTALVRDYWLTGILMLNDLALALTAERFYAGFFGIALVIMLSGYPAHLRIISTLKLNVKESELAMGHGIIE